MVEEPGRDETSSGPALAEAALVVVAEEEGEELAWRLLVLESGQVSLEEDSTEVGEGGEEGREEEEALVAVAAVLKSKHCSLCD